MPVDIRVRYANNTYAATIKGQKQSASCTISARDAAAALARKLGLDPAQLSESTTTDQVVLFRLDETPPQQQIDAFPRHGHCNHGPDMGCGRCAPVGIDSEGGSHD